MNVIFGIGSLFMADLLSGGNPLWPALGLLALVGGEIYPFFDLIQKQPVSNYNLRCYFGGLFYLYPGMTLTISGLALQTYFLTENWMATLFAFAGVVPVLLNYMQVSPAFFWVAIGVEFLLIWRFKDEIWKKILSDSSTKQGQK